MGTWQNIKNLIGLGNNIVKAGSTALNILNKVSMVGTIAARDPI